MARKTNYAFEKNSRAKAKAAKREAKRLAKLSKKEDEVLSGDSDELQEGEQLPEDSQS